MGSTPIIATMNKLFNLLAIYSAVVREYDYKEIYNLVDKVTNNINSKFCCKMSKRHDENKDLRLISRVAKIDYSNKTIQASKNAIIGIRTLGRIDYLVNHCGWFFYWNNNVRISNSNNYSDNDNAKKYKRETKKLAKENSLINKRKKR